MPCQAVRTPATTGRTFRSLAFGRTCTANAAGNVASVITATRILGLGWSVKRQTEFLVGSTAETAGMKRGPDQLGSIDLARRVSDAVWAFTCTLAQVG